MQNSIFTSTFLKKIFHRRSLFHMLQNISHKFALQIYFTYIAEVNCPISSSLSWLILPSSTR